MKEKLLSVKDLRVAINDEQLRLLEAAAIYVHPNLSGSLELIAIERQKFNRVLRRRGNQFEDPILIVARIEDFDIIRLFELSLQGGWDDLPQASQDA